MQKRLTKEDAQKLQEWAETTLEALDGRKQLTNEERKLMEQALKLKSTLRPIKYATNPNFLNRKERRRLEKLERSN